MSEPIDDIEAQASDILNDAAQRIAALDDIHGMPLSVVIGYVIMSEDGEEHIGGQYTGGYLQALGLVTDARYRLLDDTYGE